MKRGISCGFRNSIPSLVTDLIRRKQFLLETRVPDAIPPTWLDSRAQKCLFFSWRSIAAITATIPLVQIQINICEDLSRTGCRAFECQASITWASTIETFLNWVSLAPFLGRKPFSWKASFTPRLLNQSILHTASAVYRINEHAYSSKLGLSSD